MPTTLDFGQIRFVHRGPYNAATTYELNDVVSYNFSSYVYTAPVATAGTVPTDTARWALLAGGVDPNSVNTAATGAASTAAATAARTQVFLQMGA